MMCRLLACAPASDVTLKGRIGAIQATVPTPITAPRTTAGSPAVVRLGTGCSH